MIMKTCLRIRWMLLLAIALLAVASCNDSPTREIDISFQSDNSQLVAAVADVNKSLSERLSLVEAAMESGLADSQTALTLVQKAVESLRGSMDEKVAALLEAVQSQGASLETKLALIEAALDSGFADEKVQQTLLGKAIASLTGTLDERVAALETVVKSQMTGLDTKLGLIEAAVQEGLADNAAAQGLLKEAIASLGGTMQDKLAAIDSVLGSQQTALSAKLSLIETAVDEGFAGGKTQQELILQALDSLRGSRAEKLAAIDSAVASRTASLTAKLSLIETALNSGISSEAAAMQQLQAAVSSLKGAVDGMDKAIDGIIAVLGTFDSNTISVAAALSRIQSAVSGLPTSGEKLAAIEQTLKTFMPKVINGHEYVEMGDGLKWATCNVGATTPEEYGDFFAWGETEKKDNYSFEKYKYITDKNYTKYNNSDKLTMLELADDAARANWGGTWRMPTDKELDWLRDNCTWKWTDNYGGIGAKGVIVTSLVSGYAGNQLFFPAAGFQTNADKIDVGSKGNYWSSCLKPVSTEAKTEQAYNLRFYGSEISQSTRFSGLSVRPVSD